MKKVLSNSILFLGHNIFIKEACPACGRPIGMSIKHKKTWNIQEKLLLARIFYGHLGMEGKIDWGQNCFKDHVHCHFEPKAKE